MFNLRTLCLSIFIFLYINQQIVAPGNQRENINTKQIKTNTSQTSGVDTLITVIKFGQSIGYLTPETSITPKIRNVIQEYNISDNTFEMFLSTASNIINSMTFIIRPFGDNQYLRLFDSTKNDIYIGRLLMNIGHLISNVANRINDVTDYRNHQINYDIGEEIFTFEQLQDLEEVGQLTPRELLELPNLYFLRGFDENGMLDGGKILKKKNIKTKRRKIKRRKTKRIK